jgi:hypothetical protein
MRLHDRELRDEPDLLVGAAKINPGLGRRPLAMTIDFDAADADNLCFGISAKYFEGGDLCAARASEAPGLLQDAAACTSVAVTPMCDVVVATRSEKPGEVLVSGTIVDARLLDDASRLASQVEREQRLKIAAGDDKIGSAVHLSTLVVGRKALRANVRRDKLRDPYLPYAVRFYLFEVLFEHNPARHKLDRVDFTNCRS